tara:strand:+ start:3622 stop:3903 length:282 start_codon:yes stop_codon:yes gene_type:complete
MQAICIDDKNKPEIIPQDEWIEEGIVYTVTGVHKMVLQSTKLGFELKEIQLTEDSAPYEFYDAERFLLIFNPNNIDFIIKKSKITEPANFDLI